MPTQCNKIIRVCEVCHTNFLAWPHEVRDGQAKFCSRKCLAVSKRVPLHARFVKFVGLVTESGCQLWLGKLDSHGYGVINSGITKGHRFRSHRVAYEIAHGPIPDGMEVCHTCDTPACVCVEHLFLGSQADNAADMVAKQRSLIGVKNFNAKLTDEQILEIRRLWKTGTIYQKTLAREYGVTTGLIGLIVRRKIWRHLL